MLDGLTDFIDKILKVFGSWYDEGYFFYGILVLGILAIVAFVLVISLFFIGLKDQPPEQTQEQIDIENNAMDYCTEKGFNNWKWINNTMFECYTTENQSTDLNKYHIS